MLYVNYSDSLPTQKIRLAVVVCSIPRCTTYDVGPTIFIPINQQKVVTVQLIMSTLAY